MLRAIGINPVKTEPTHHVFNRIDVFGGFFLRVGVVKTQVATPAVTVRRAKIQANTFCVTYVQVAVRLRWKTRNHIRQWFALRIHAMPVFTCCDVGINFLANEIGYFSVFGVMVNWACCAHAGLSNSNVIGCVAGFILMNCRADCDRRIHFLSIEFANVFFNTGNIKGLQYAVQRLLRLLN